MEVSWFLFVLWLEFLFGYPLLVYIKIVYNFTIPCRSSPETDGLLGVEPGS